MREGLKAHRTAVGRNRRDAERALKKIDVQIDEGDYRPIAAIRFVDFADGWLKRLECKETTRDSYRSTVAYAKQAFGAKHVRQLRPLDVVKFNDDLKEKKLTASTRAKHLRVLHACLSSAVSHGYAARNPAEMLPEGERPRPDRRESAYFTNDEIPRLFAAVPDRAGDVPNVYRVLFLTALKTGMRLGELLALRWADVELLEPVESLAAADEPDEPLGGTIHVRRSVTDGHLSTPKNHEKRGVDLAADITSTLRGWYAICEAPSDDRLVFPSLDGRCLVGTTILRRELYPAMTAAKVPRVGPTEEKRTFHSFRHTYAKRALETGRSITWLSRHLGHSSLKVTTDVYGHWETAERQREARQMEVFGV